MANIIQLPEPKTDVVYYARRGESYTEWVKRNPSGTTADYAAACAARASHDAQVDVLRRESESIRQEASIPERWKIGANEVGWVAPNALT